LRFCFATQSKHRDGAAQRTPSTDEQRERRAAALLLDESSALRPDFCDQLADLLGRDAAAGLLASWSEAK